MAGTITAAILGRIRANTRDDTAGAYAVTDAQIYGKLNDTELELSLTLPTDLLSEFVTPYIQLTISGGSASMSALSVLGSYKRAIIRVYDETDSKWVLPLSDKELVLLNNGMLAPTIADPRFRIAGTLLYVYPTTGIATVRVDHLKVPTAISATTDPTINAGLYYLLQKGAENRVRATIDDKLNLQQLLQQDYYNHIAKLNGE